MNSINSLQAIGVMDSGVGGLTVVKEIVRQLPNEKIIYYGDVKHCPYGQKSLEEVLTYTLNAAEFLIQQNIKMLVIACNTATSVALNALNEKYDIPIIGVIQPGARTAIQVSQNNEVLVLATEGTVKSNQYQHEIQKLNQEFKVESLPCPDFVPLVESMQYKDKGITRVTIGHTFERIQNVNADTVILGCTHYPLIANDISEYFNHQKKVIDSAFETAREVSSILNIFKIEAMNTNHIQHEIYINQAHDFFDDIIKDWLPSLNYSLTIMR